MVFVKGKVNHIPFEIESDEPQDYNEILPDLDDHLEIIPGLEEKVKTVSSSQAAPKKIEDEAKSSSP
jgi:hypothetical protein